MNCDRCRNKGICKYEDDSRTFEKKVTEATEGFGKPEPIKLLFNCEKFHAVYIPEFRSKKITETD